MNSSFIILAALIFLGWVSNPTRAAKHGRNHLINIFHGSANAAKCHPDDEAGLLAFRSGITEDPLDILRDWKKGTNCCEWYEVRCNEKNRVRGIFIIPPYPAPPEYILAGTPFLPSLAKLQHLTEIYIYDLKNITGPFPQFLFQLPKIKSVHLYGNSLSGPLPGNFSSLRTLEQLSIANNRFTGPFPSSVSKMPRLRYLDISNNEISGDPIRLLNQTKKIWHFMASGNKLRFDLEKLTILKTQTRLDLSRNLIFGKVPPTVANLVSLNLRHNHLCGKLPPTRFPASAFSDNDCLCGSPLPPCKA